MYRISTVFAIRIFSEMRWNILSFPTWGEWDVEGSRLFFRNLYITLLIFVKLGTIMVCNLSKDLL